MRRSLSILMAAAVAAGASFVSLAPAEAAALRLAPEAATSAQGGGATEPAAWRGRENEEGWSEEDGGRRWRDDDNRRYRQHNRRRHHHNQQFVFPRQFYFGFPFAFAPPYYPYGGYRDCFRTWEGRVICR